MRCRENFLKSNFPSLFEDRKCIAAPVCNEMDIEKHIYECYYFSKKNEIAIENVEYEYIYQNNVLKQIQVMNIFNKKMRIRKSLMSPNSPLLGTPDDPCRGRGGRKIGKSTLTQPRLGIREAKTKYSKQNKKRNI